MYPYIGITDFTSFEQVQRMLAVFKKHRRRGLKRRLHVGVMMSHATLHGLETKWSKAFPPKEQIAEIFGSDKTMNCLHYADYRAIDVADSLIQAIGFGGVGINALQLDMVWPDPGHVAHAIHTSRKGLEVILQLGDAALEGHAIAEIVRRLEDYRGVIHYVLLDRSMGNGREMDAVGFLPLARALRESFPEWELAAAGGLGPDTVSLVEPLVREFPFISIDAQSKLRHSGNALDPIDWDLAEKYLTKAWTLF